MFNFTPDGCVPTQQAVQIAANHWFTERIEALESAQTHQADDRPEDHIGKAVRAFSSPYIDQDQLQALKQIFIDTVQRLRDFLHQGRIDAYYFTSNGRQTLSRHFWASAEADGALEEGVYWPYGKPTRVFESRPRYQLVLKELDLETLLNPPVSKKRPLPESMTAALATALKSLDHLPNRAAQLEALRELPEFRGYEITHKKFREVTGTSPRKSGVKARGKS